MKRQFLLLLFTLAIVETYATGTGMVERNEFPMVKVITKGGKIILGQLQYVTDSSIHVMPGTNKESRKKRYYERVEIPYSEIISIRYRDFNWLALILSLAGMSVIYLMITGVIPVFNNGLGDANFLIWLSPLLFGYSILQLFKRKRYVINGNRERFAKFKQWHEKKSRSKESELRLK